MMKQTVLIILLIMSSIILISCQENGSSTSSSLTSSFKDYVLNPDKYDGTNITIYGRVVGSCMLEPPVFGKYFGNCDPFVDKEGYAVFVVSNKRLFEQNKYYTVSGQFIKSEHNYPYLVE